MTDRRIDSVTPAVVPSGGLKIRGDSGAAMKRPPLPLARHWLLLATAARCMGWRLLMCMAASLIGR